MKIICMEFNFVENAYSQVCVWCCNYAKKLSIKDVPINNYEILNRQACSCFWNMSCTQSLVVSCKYWVIPLISTWVPGCSQVMLLETCVTRYLGQGQAVTSPDYQWDVITWPCPWYPLLAHTSSIILSVSMLPRASTYVLSLAYNFHFTVLIHWLLEM